MSFLRCEFGLSQQLVVEAGSAADAAILVCSCGGGAKGLLVLGWALCTIKQTETKLINGLFGF